MYPYGGDDPDVKEDETICDFYTSDGFVPVDTYVRVHGTYEQALTHPPSGKFLQSVVVNPIPSPLPPSSPPATSTHKDSLRTAPARAATATAHATRLTITSMPAPLCAVVINGATTAAVREPGGRGTGGAGGAGAS